jgi:hypothetical protein
MVEFIFEKFSLGILPAINFFPIVTGKILFHPIQGKLWNKWPKFADDCCLFLNCHAIKGDTSFNSVSSSVDFDEVFSKSPDFSKERKT